MNYSNHQQQLNVLVYKVLTDRYHASRIEDACSISLAETITDYHVAYIAQILDEITDLTGTDYSMSHQEIRTRFACILGNLEREFESKIDDSLKDLQKETSKLVTARARAEAKAANDLIEKVNEILNKNGVQNETVSKS